MEKSDSKLNILFLPKWYPTPLDLQNGVFVKNHASIVSEYANVYVLYVQGDPNLTKPFSIHISEGKLPEIIVFFKADKSVFGKIINLLRYLTATYSGYRLIQNRNFTPNICHLHVMTRPAILALALQAVYNIPFIVTEHWTGYSSGLYDKWSSFKKNIHNWILTKSSAITVVSESLKSTLSKITDKEIFVIPNVIGAKFEYAPLNTSEKIIILTVADLDNKKKNVSDIIEVLAEIYKTHKNFEYHIIGDGNDRKMLASLAEKVLPKSGVIVFHGLQDNEYVADFIKKSDFIVINSNFETFGVIGVEALASGRPVIATRSGGPEEYVKDEFGILINPGSKDDLKESIIQMLASCRSYDGIRMSKYIKEKYSSHKIGHQFLNIYSSIVK